MKRALFIAAALLIATLPALAQSVRERLTEKIPESKRLLFALTPEDEVRVGKQVAANLLGVAPLVADAELQRYVNRVGRWVARQSERPDLPWHFGVVESADVNAFAAPGGYILLTRGLYQSLSDEAELAGVLGHEVAHVVRKDHIELMRKGALIEEGREALERNVNDKDEWLRRIVGSGAEIFARRLDQAAEFEADRRGVIYAARAGYTPYGLPAVLQKLGSAAPGDDRLQLLFKTHPSPAARLKQLDAAADTTLLSLDGSAGGSLYSLK